MDKPFPQEPENPGDVQLPVTITGIKPQKKQIDRFSLFHKNQFIIGVSSGTLLKLGLEKGVEITPFLFNKIQAEEQKQKIKNYFLRLLGRRNHTARELKTKAAQKGYDTTLADSILNQLEQKGYLNDEEFARNYTSDKIRLKNWGPVKIRAYLRKKGIENRIINDVLSKEADSLELKKICVDLIEKRKRHFQRETDNFKRTQKIAAYLQRKGFTYDTINRAMPDIIDKLNV